jgi:hypothetical protein
LAKLVANYYSNLLIEKTKEEMIKLILSCKYMLLIIIIVCILVLLAMGIDLVSGLNKAKKRGEVKSSYALSRSLTKFITYEGGIIIAACIDVLIHLSNFFLLIHLKILYDVPIVTIIIGIFLLAVELLSIREKADDKIRKSMNDTAKIAIDVAQKKEIKEALIELLKSDFKNDKQD